MTDELKQTVHLIRRGKVTTDDRGQTVWDGTVEEAELELVSTQTLKRMLDSSDLERRERLEEVASTREGVLARNTSDDSFEVIGDADLEAALASADAEKGPARSADVVYEPVSTPEDGEELSLVSTQMLRRILGAEDDATVDDEAPPAEPNFDPYNSG